MCVSLGNPTVTRSEFVHFLADEFGLSRAAAASKVVLMQELKALLEDRRARGATTVLLIDEAQSLPYELLEEVRLLANLETDTEKLLPVVLVGQPELADRLNEPSLRQLKQRVAIRCTVTPLHVNAAAAYVLARVRKAGGNGSNDIHAGGGATDIQPFQTESRGRSTSSATTSCWQGLRDQRSR